MSVRSVSGTALPWPPSTDGAAPLTRALAGETRLIIQQAVNVLEAFTGFEQRNRYEILTERGEPLAEVAEKAGDLLHTIGRLLWRAGRPFRLHVISGGARLLTVERRWFWFLSSVDVSDGAGAHVGRIEQRWAFFRRRLELLDPVGNPLADIVGPFFHPWTFDVRRPGSGDPIALIEKRWSGFGRELFTNADTFAVSLPDNREHALAPLLLAAALMIDFCWFERETSVSASGSFWPDSTSASDTSSGGGWADTSADSSSGGNSGGGGDSGGSDSSGGDSGGSDSSGGDSGGGGDS